jgi:ferredoxin
MADLNQKLPENAPGAFYVDATCIDCELCRELAPAHFTRQDNQGYSYVYRQPRSGDEAESCESARQHCPVEAIGRTEG